MLKSIYNAIIDSVFPPRCPLCHKDTAKQGDWCSDCYRKAVDYHKLPLTKQQSAVIYPVWTVCRYQTGVKKLIQELKYQRQFKHLVHIQTILAQELKLFAIANYDIAVPVPLHQQRLMQRGFNQTSKIFQPWAANNKLPWLDCLERQRATAPQYGLSAAQRRCNTAKSFQLKAKMTVANQRILLLDDIFTTGSTMDNCAAVLKKAGAKSISGLVLASDA